MSNSFTLQQISRTSNLDSNQKPRQYNLNIMAKFLQIKFET